MIRDCSSRQYGVKFQVLYSRSLAGDWFTASPEVVAGQDSAYLNTAAIEDCKAEESLESSFDTVSTDKANLHCSSESAKKKLPLDFELWPAAGLLDRSNR